MLALSIIIQVKTQARFRNLIGGFGDAVYQKIKKINVKMRIYSRVKFIDRTNSTHSLNHE